MTIRIVLPENKHGGAITGAGTKVFAGDTEIKEVTAIRFEIGVDRILGATIEVAVSSIENMDSIFALLGVDTLEDIAALHDYKMTAIDGGAWGGP